MAILSGTTTSYAPVRGIREDLEDTIWELYPEDTWALSNLDKVDATQQFHEWQSDTLAGATVNRVVEGNDAAFTTLSPTTRLGNYLQVSAKYFFVSGSVEASKMAGRRSELARNARKLMRELKRDMEQALIGNQGSSAGSVSVPRSSGGMESWIQGVTQNPGTAGNAIRSTTTADAATTVGFGSNVVTSPVDGTTTGALSITALNSALQGGWQNGGNPRIILAGPVAKAAIDGFTSIATRMVDIDVEQAPIIGAANVYVSDFGRHTVILSRYIRSSVVLCLDPEFWAVAYLRRPFIEDLAKTGDGMKKQILTEFTLVSRNYLASAKVVAIA